MSRNRLIATHLAALERRYLPPEIARRPAPHFCTARPCPKPTLPGVVSHIVIEGSDGELIGPGKTFVAYEERGA